MSIKAKRITKSNTVSIPRDIRCAMGLAAGMPIKIESTGSSIMISKYVPCCRICGSPEQVLNFDGAEICVNCAKKAVEEWENANS